MTNCCIFYTFFALSRYIPNSLWIDSCVRHRVTDDDDNKNINNNNNHKNNNSLTSQVCGERDDAYLSKQHRVQLMSRKVWELLMMLPTSPGLMKTFEAIADDQQQQQPKLDVVDIPKLLEPENPHKLMYSLQIVEYLSKPAR